MTGMLGYDDIRAGTVRQVAPPSPSCLRIQAKRSRIDPAPALAQVD